MTTTTFPNLDALTSIKAALLVSDVGEASRLLAGLRLDCAGSVLMSIDALRHAVTVLEDNVHESMRRADFDGNLNETELRSQRVADLVERMLDPHHGIEHGAESYDSDRLDRLLDVLGNALADPPMAVLLTEALQSFAKPYALAPVALLQHMQSLLLHHLNALLDQDQADEHAHDLADALNGIGQALRHLDGPHELAVQRTLTRLKTAATDSDQRRARLLRV